MLLDDATCHFAALDIDEKDFSKALSARNIMRDMGVSSYISESKGKGYHVYLFAQTAFVAKDVRQLLRAVLDQAGYNTEIFPKQDALDDTIKYGNYINLPYFKLNSRQFLNVKGEKLSFNDACPKIQRVSNDLIEAVLQSLPAETPLLVPLKTTKKVTAVKGKKQASPACIQAISRGVSQGQRDVAAFALARHYLDQGYLPEEVLAMMIQWDKRNNPPIGDQHVLQIKVQSAAKGGYRFGCNSIIDEALLAAYCPGKDQCQWLIDSDKDRKKKGFVVETSFLETETHLYEEIMLTGSTGKASFVSREKTTGEINYADRIDDGEVTYVPFYNDEITEEAVRLPTGLAEYSSLKLLVKDIKAHIYKYLDLKPKDLEFVSWYVIMTWTYDKLPNVQYLRFLGDTGCGKSRSLDVIGDICYKTMMLSGAVTPAPIYRIIKKFRGTLVLDEADFSDTTEKSEVVTILNCLKPGTLVTGSPSLKIEDAKVGDLVLAHDGLLHPTTKTFERPYNGRIVKIIPGRSNLPIEITGEHLVLLKNGWDKASNITVEDRLAVAKPKIPDNDLDYLSFKVKAPFKEKGITRLNGRWSPKSQIDFQMPLCEETAWMLGFYIAEGCASNNYLIFTLGSHENEKVSKLSSIFERYFNYKPSISHYTETTHVTVCISGLGDGFEEMFGVKAPNKKIPSELLTLPKSKLISLIRGLMDGDGHVQPSQGFGVLTTSSEPLVMSLRLALMRLGILPSVYYQGQSSSVIQGRKIKTGQRWLVRISMRDMTKLGYIAPYTPGIPHVQEDRDYWYVRVREVSQEHYEGPIYNLAVEGAETYSGINFVAHNCGYERGRPIVRCAKDDPDLLQILPCFGPKLFATRFTFEDKALESRCMTVKMVETTRSDIPPYLGRSYHSSVSQLRNQLLLYRLRTYTNVDPEAGEDIDLGNIEPRLKQTGIPYAIPFMNDPEVMDRYKEYILQRNQDLIQERADSGQGRLLLAFLKLALEQGKNQVTANSMQKLCSEEMKMEITTRSIGKIVKSLGITKRRAPGGRAYLYNWDRELLESLKKRYYPNETDFDDLFSGEDLLQDL